MPLASVADAANENLRGTIEPGDGVTNETDGGVESLHAAVDVAAVEAEEADPDASRATTANANDVPHASPDTGSVVPLSVAI